MEAYEELFSFLFECEKIDTHEHLLSSDHYLQSNDILFAVLERSYLPWIIFGARDLPGRTVTRQDLLEGMKKVPAAAFYRYLIRAFSSMYGFEGEFLSEENWNSLAEAIRECYLHGNMIEKWLVRYLNIKKIVWDRYWLMGNFLVDRPLFSPVLRIDPLLYGYSRQAGDHDGKNPFPYADETGISVRNFDDYLALIDSLFRKGVEGGVCAVKCAIAYNRSLSFEHVDRKKAEAVFNPAGPVKPDSEIKGFQDYVFRYCLEKAREHQFPVQIHTGPGYAFQSDPSRLGTIFEEYRDIKISLFHGGFPWVGEPGAMALFYPNLYLDLVWLPVMSPSFAVMALTEWIEATGGSRIMVGGDSWNAEGVVGSFLFNLECIAETLARLVDKKYITLSTARDIGKMILWDNPREFFGSRLQVEG